MSKWIRQSIVKPVTKGFRILPDLANRPFVPMLQLGLGKFQTIGEISQMVPLAGLGVFDLFLFENPCTQKVP